MPPQCEAPTCHLRDPANIRAEREELAPLRSGAGLLGLLLLCSANLGALALLAQGKVSAEFAVMFGEAGRREQSEQMGALTAEQTNLQRL